MIFHLMTQDYRFSNCPTFLTECGAFKLRLMIQEKEIEQLAKDYATKFVPLHQGVAEYAFYEGMVAAQELINERLREL